MVRVDEDDNDNDNIDGNLHRPGDDQEADRAGGRGLRDVAVRDRDVAVPRREPPPHRRGGGG